MLRTIFLFVFAVTLSGSAFGDTVIDFESLERVDSDFQVFGNDYVEDGFVLSEGSGSGLGNVGTLEPRYTGSTAVAGGSASSLYVLTRQGGGSFDVLSIDLAEFSTDEGGSPTVNFTGILSAGGIVSQSFTLDGNAFSAESFSFDPGFNNVVALVWQQSAPGHQFDNINLNVVPEPTAGMFAVMGLAGLAARRRR